MVNMKVSSMKCFLSIKEKKVQTTGNFGRIWQIFDTKVHETENYGRFLLESTKYERNFFPILNKFFKYAWFQLPLNYGKEPMKYIK